MIRSLFILFLLSFSLTGYSQADVKSAQIRKLLELTGSIKVATQMMDQMIAGYKANLTNVPSEFWDEFKKEIDADGLIKLVIPIYDKYYSEEDLRQLIAFYETPIGRKVIEKTPFIARDSYASGEQWGKEIGTRVLDRLKEKGYSQSN